MNVQGHEDDKILTTGAVYPQKSSFCNQDLPAATNAENALSQVVYLKKDINGATSIIR